MKFLLLKLISFLGSDSALDNKLDPLGYNETWWCNTLAPIAETLGKILVPLLILVASAGSIYAVVLGVTYAKCENGEKRDEARKRMVNAIIGFVVLLILLILLVLFCKYVNDIGRWVTNLINQSRDGA